MSRGNFWIDAERVVDKVVVLDEDTVLVASPKESEIPGIRAALEAGQPAASVVKDATVVPIASITRVSYDRNAEDLDVDFQQGKDSRSEDILFSSPDERNAFADQLAERLQGFESRTVAWGRPRAAAGPLAFGLVTTFLTWVLHGFAAELAAGTDVEVSGRRAGLKRLVVGIVDLIGPTGVLIVGGLLLAFTAAYLVQRVRTPPIMTTLKKR